MTLVLNEVVICRVDWAAQAMCAGADQKISMRPLHTLCSACIAELRRRHIVLAQNWFVREVVELVAESIELLGNGKTGKQFLSDRA